MLQFYNVFTIYDVHPNSYGGAILCTALEVLFTINVKLLPMSIYMNKNHTKSKTFETTILLIRFSLRCKNTNFANFQNGFPQE